MSQQFTFKILMAASALIFSFATNGYAVFTPEEIELKGKDFKVNFSFKPQESTPEPETKKVKPSLEEETHPRQEKKKWWTKISRKKKREKIFAERDARKEEVKKLKSSSGLLNVEGTNSDCLFFAVPAKILIRIVNMLDFQGWKSLRLTCKGGNKLSLSEDFASRYCLTITEISSTKSEFYNGDKYSYRLFTWGIKKKFGSFTSYPAALRYVWKHDGKDLDNLNKILMFNKYLSTFIFDIRPSLLNGELDAFVEMLNLKPYIHTLVLPLYKGGAFDTIAQEKMGKRFKHLKSLIFGKRELPLNSREATTSPSH